jgi:predicted lipid-binding transport protein (Tim44 family)
VATLVILAMVFVFVALRLWSVLGRRTGHEQTLPKPDRMSAARPTVSVPATDAAPQPAPEPALSTAASAGLRAISAADPQFDAPRFVDGAKQAYAMVLEAYWKGDQDALDRLVDREVALAFAHAIAEREEAGERLDNRLVAIEQAVIEDARVENGTAHIRLRFEADVAAVTRNADDEVVAGSLTDAVQTHDVWTFSRAVKSTDPNWLLTETDEAS